MSRGEKLDIAARIIRHGREHPEHAALTINHECWTYSELLGAAGYIAGQLKRTATDQPQPVTGIIVERTATSYLGILACVLKGHTYVPLHLDRPDAHLASVLNKSGLRQIICSQISIHAIDRLQKLSHSQHPIETIICGHNKEDFDDHAIAVDPMPAASPLSNIAYILFTSGSTGEPKGVPISYGNLTGYLDAATNMMQPSANDRVSQMFELTFDLSVHDLFVSWTNCAHLIVPSRGEEAKPAEYIRTHEITCWFSVPSVAYQMRLQGALRANAFPSLRSSLFCGEALPLALAKQWAIAAPNSTVENWYGPTEATIACARYVLTADDLQGENDEGLVPIGKAFVGMSLSVHGKDHAISEVGQEGELLLSGRQLSQGYLSDPEKSAKSFIKLDGSNETFYRTGDRVVQAPDGNIRFLGRIDNQVKIRGFRVELGEVETTIRRVSGGCNAIATPWPTDSTNCTSIIAAIESPLTDTGQMLQQAAESLPDYMVPTRIECIDRFPTNASGKADRKAIATLITKRISHPDVQGSSIRHKLSDEAEQLMDAILLVSPMLTSKGILTSETLLAAGMDSLSFVSLTAEIERIFDKILDQDEVVELSELSFFDMVTTLKGEKKQAQSTASSANFLSSAAANVRGIFGNKKPVEPAKPTKVRRVANRSIQFIERFPITLDTLHSPPVIAIGSSGVFRSFSPKTFDAAAKSMGQQLQSINVGLPAVSCSGLIKITEFVRDCCQQSNLRLPVAIYELDPMHVSVLPPKGDTNLTLENFSGQVKSHSDEFIDTEFNWEPAVRGAWTYNLESARQKQRPNWERKRDYEIARTYLGDVNFVKKQIDTWIEGANLLATIADRVICFIHPIDATMAGEIPPQKQGRKFKDLISQIARTPKLELIPWQDFVLDSEDYLNINHVNPWSGMPKLSEQLARMIFSQE